MRSFFVATVLFGTLLATWANRVQRQRSVAQSVCQLGGSVLYSNPFLPIPAAVIRFVGYDYFCSIQSITLYPTQELTADQQIRSLANVRQLQRLAIWPQSTQVAIVDPSIRAIDEYLAVGYKPAPYGVDENDVPGGLTEAGLERLLKTLPNLEHLSLISARISPDSTIYWQARRQIPSFDMLVHPHFASPPPAHP